MICAECWRQQETALNRAGSLCFSPWTHSCLLSPAEFLSHFSSFSQSTSKEEAESITKTWDETRRPPRHRVANSSSSSVSANKQLRRLSIKGAICHRLKVQSSPTKGVLRRAKSEFRHFEMLQCLQMASKKHRKQKGDKDENTWNFRRHPITTCSFFHRRTKFQTAILTVTCLPQYLTE